ncbi:MAG: transposase [Flavobacteriales bacterium Tduv]
MEDRKKRAKANQSKKRKGKKRDSIRSRTQGKWPKKSEKIYYGYKKHIGGIKNGMILENHSVADNEHDSRGVKPLISKLGYKSIEVYADKGYPVPTNVSYFHSRGSKTETIVLMVDYIYSSILDRLR